MFILDICCNALSAGERGWGRQCNVSKTYYSKIWLNSEP